MACITALRAAYRGSKRRSITVDGEEWRTTSAAVVRELGLAEGDDVDTDRLETSISAAEIPAARDRALRLLGYREHGSIELREKLITDGYPMDLASRTVDSLLRVGFVDDDRYAALLARTLIDGRAYGRTRAYREMLRRKLSEEQAQVALDACCPESGEYARALELARTWARPGGDVRKLAARLARRGYPVRTCFEAAASAFGLADEQAVDDTL
ncbi:MAG: regulatory protein RecX [Coriobacteriia bacterium]|nr:regulatory protein RecX [Coriobacteriia bacterium]